MSYPFHMRRRRSGEGLSQGQHDRFIEEKNAQRRDLLAELIRVHVRHRGLAGFEEIERMACAARDELLGSAVTDGACRGDNSPEE